MNVNVDRNSVELFVRLYRMKDPKDVSWDVKTLFSELDDITDDCLYTYRSGMITENRNCLDSVSMSSYEFSLLKKFLQENR